MPKLEHDLEAAFAAFGLRLVDVSDRYPYSDRKSKTYAVFDGNNMICTYASLQRVKQWAKDQLTNKWRGKTDDGSMESRDR